MEFVKKVLEKKRDDLKGYIEREKHNLEMANVESSRCKEGISTAENQLKEVNKALEAYQCDQEK